MWCTIVPGHKQPATKMMYTSEAKSHCPEHDSGGGKKRISNTNTDETGSIENEELINPPTVGGAA